MNFEVRHTWVRSSISQLSGFGKLIHLLEHITSTRIGLLLPQGKVSFLYLPDSWRFTTNIMSAIFFSLLLNLHFIIPQGGNISYLRPCVNNVASGGGRGREQPCALSVCPAGWLCSGAACLLLWKPGLLFQVALSSVLIDLSLPRLLAETLGWRCHCSSQSKHY